MALSFDTPQEDELATNVLTSGTSPYMPLAFMRQEPQFRRFFSFKTASPEEKQQWAGAFMHLAKKLTLRARIRGQKGSRLLLKSPVHTARIEFLLQLFPDAQFVYIHRHPFDVFKSAVHMADTTYWYTYMNTPTDNQILSFILNQYDTLYSEYMAGKKVLQDLEQQHGQPRLVEVSFNQLEDDPAATIRNIYNRLQWEGADQAANRAGEHCKNRLKGYKKNTFTALSREQQDLVRRRWGPSFKQFGYATHEASE